MAWLLTLAMLLTVFSPLSAMADDLSDIIDETDIVCGEDTDYLAQASDIATCADVVLTADEIESYFRKRVGQAYDNGMCMRFVREGFQALGGPLSSACCAYNYGNSHIQSTDINTIPIGADVFFGNCGGGPCKSCHSTYYGHIGVYVGNDQFVHATGGKVQITSLKGSNWKNKFRGWGYHGGITVTGGSNNLPNLCVDVVQGWQNHIYVKGWAFDPDTPNAKVAVHVYINNECHEVIADKYHDQELDDTFHCGTDHGFALDIPTDQTGEVNVSFYAIDEQDANQHSEPSDSYSSYKNPTKVTITSDKTGPTITNAKVTNVDSTGYTVTCTVTDASGVNRVQFPTWTEKNGQDDLLSNWEVSSKASGTRNGNTFTFRVKTSDHNNESGVYHTHIYAYDNSYRGNCAGAVTLTATVPVPTVAVSGVRLNKTSLSFTGTGSSQTLTATVSPSNATNKTITWSSSNTSVATVSNGVVKAVGFGTATITAKSNNGKTASCSVTVNPIQPTGIKATPETSTLYGLNGTVKLSANVMPSNATNKAVTWSSRNTSVATVSSDGTVKAVGYGTTVITATTVNGLTSNCTINVKKEEVTSLTIATKPTKTNYYVGDTLNTAGLTLKAAYNNGTTQTITSGFTCTPTALTSAGTQTVTVNYGGKTATFAVNVQDVTLSGIAIASNPTKTSYYVGDTLDTTGLKLTATYNNGTTQTITGGFTCTPTALTSAGTQTVTVNYGGKTATFAVNVQDVTLSGIAVASNPSKTSYFVGDTLDTTGLKLTATYSNGTTQTITGGFTCTPTALSTAGAQTVTVSYGGKTATFTVNVQDVTLSGIAIASNPTKTSYYVGNTLDTTGLKLTATYNNGTTQTITGGFTCTPTALTSAGTQTVTVNYGGKTATFAVNVQDVTLSGIAIASNPTKTSYYVGDTLDTTGLKLTATYSNGTTQTITSGFTCTPTALSTAGVQTVTVNYGGKTATFAVNVELPVLPFVTLTFDPTDGVLDLADTPEKTVYPGEAYGRLPEPTADGMVFLGWYTESGKRITSLATCDLTGDATVSARWALASAEGWSFDEATGTLTLDGSGAMKEYTSAAEAPWYSYHDSIEHLVVKSGVTSLSSYAFVGCQNLADITLPDTLQTIGTMTFYGCDSLNNVTIPASVRTIGSYAFADALSLSRITFAGDAPEFGTGVFTFRKLTAYYPVYASGWETVVDGRYDFGGSITWVRSSESLAAEESVLLSAAEPDDVLALDWTL